MRHRPTNFALTALLATTLAATSLAQGPATTAPAARDVDPAVAAFLKPIEPTADDGPLRRKLAERHNTAVRLLEAHIERYRKGVADASAVFASAREVADAKMALARDASERLATARQVVEVTRAVETRVEEQFKAGLGPEVTWLRARLARETAEIMLLTLQEQKPPSAAATAPTTRPRPTGDAN